MNLNKIYIDGKWIESESKEFIEVEDPTNQEIFAKVPRGNEIDGNKAIQAAKNAFPQWCKTEPEKRVEYVEKMIDYLVDSVDEILPLLARELGQPEIVSRRMHLVQYEEGMRGFITAHKDIKYEERREKYLLRQEPIGVVGALTPWNYPFGQIAKKVIPALLTGNTIILKPSQSTPITGYFWAKAAEAAKLPPGVFNLLIGTGKEIGDILVNSQDVHMISFTGSTKVGKDLAIRSINSSMKRIALELGGKSAAIVLEGGDLKLAAKEVLNTIYMNSGQSCSAATRMFLPRKYKEEIEKVLLETTLEYKLEFPFDKDSDMGVLHSKKQYDKVKSYIENGIEEGAKLLIGEIPKEAVHGKGYHIGPTIFVDVDNKMKIAQEEIFGPVLSVIYYDTVEEAIEMANDSIYGLSGMVFGPEKEAKEVSDQIRTGMVIVNGTPRSQNAPFGGFKSSGLGREGAYEGMSEFLQYKTVFI